MSLPTADDLFRPTVEEQRTAGMSVVPDDAGTADAQASPDGRRQPSGRVRHDEKMTVYVTAGELVDIEHARLALRRDHGMAVDRGRLVREAIAIVLADLELSGEDSVLVQRLTES